MATVEAQIPNVLPGMMMPQGQPQFNAAMPVPGTAAKTAPVSLWVGDLAQNIDETELTNVFQVFGPVASTRVVRDRVTKQSLGYAYVNFVSPADAAKAKQELSYTKIGDKVCRIMWSQRDPSARKNNVGNIFIKNISPDMTARDLYEAFKDFGEILSVKLAVDENGVSKRYGYVHFNDSESATAAIRDINNLEVDGYKVSVQVYIPRPQRDVKDNWTNVYVKNIPKSYDVEALNTLFAKYGEITSSIVMTENNDTSKSRGFGFVCFKEHKAAVDACEALSGTILEGMEAVIIPNKTGENGEPLTRVPRLYVGRAQKKTERQRAMREKELAGKREFQARFAGCNLYVKNLDDSVDEDRLRKEFEKFGKLHSVKISRHENNTSRGYGFVCFDKAEDATAARAEMNLKMIESKPLYVGVWEAKDARKARLATVMQQRNSKNSSNVVPNMQNFGVNNMNMHPMMMMMAQMMTNMNPMAMQQFMNMFRNNMMNNNMMNQRNRNVQGFPVLPMGVQAGTAPAAVGNQRGNARGGNVRQNQYPARNNNVRVPQQPQQQRAVGNRAMAPNVLLGNQVRNIPGLVDPAVLSAAPIAQVPQQMLYTQLVNVGPEEQKNMAGEKLYAEISKVRPELAGKITGMLLDSLDVSEILHLLETPGELQNRVEEAIDVLERSKTTPATA